MLPILTYHRVGTLAVDHVPTVSKTAFESHMAFLVRGRYHVISLGDMVEALRVGRPLPRRSVVLTFDDGYLGTFTEAAPVLRRFRFCATVFVATSEVSTEGFLSWDQLRTLSSDGFTVGSHTLHHAFLPSISLAHARTELVESKRILETQLNRPIRLFCYPVGGYTPQVQAIVREAGYEAACTTNRGLPEKVVDLFALRRIKMTERDSPMSLWVKLSGHYDLFRRLEPPA